MEQDEFDSLFHTFKHTAVRVETLQRYEVDEERELLRRYLAGEPAPPTLDNEWSDYIRQQVNAGRRFRRLRLIEEPLTPYVRCELDWGYLPGIRAGEEIWIVRGKSPVETNDFWLFDETAVADMRYSDQGVFLDVVVSRDPARVRGACALVEKLIASARPLREYLAEKRR